MKPRFFIISASLFLASCQLGPNFQLPSIKGTEKWKKATASDPTQLPDTWWILFQDADLNDLVDRALSANNDIAAAKARVDTSRALIGLDRAKLFPSLNFSASNSVDRYSQDGLGANLPPGVRIPLQQERYRSSFKLAYDPDLWGRNRRSVESSSAQAAATSALLDSQRLGIASEVARQYFLLRGLDAQIRILKSTIQSRQDALDIESSRKQAGLNDGLASSRARTELELANNDLSLIERQRGSAENALAVLCGTTPSNFSVKENDSKVTLPKISPGLPASVLARRPDVRAAEQNLRSANAKIGIAEAAFYPNFSLSGSGGFESLDIGKFLDWENRILSIGTGLTAPILDGGANKANYQAARSRYEEALASYRQSLLIAVQEVEDALIDLNGLTKSQTALENALTSSEETLKLSQERYDKGIISYMEVIDAQRSTLQIQLSLSQLQANQQISLALLAKSLGGGWSGK
jgi:outer membrane protein, multidrug efflux system